MSCYFVGANEEESGKITIYKHQLLIGNKIGEGSILSEYGSDSDSGWCNLMPSRLLSALIPIAKGQIIYTNVHTNEAGKQVNTRMWIVRLKKGYYDVIWNKF